MEISEPRVDGSTPKQSLVIIDHLSGFHRGSRQVLTGEDLEIGTAPDATIHFPSDHEPHVTPHHARIRRRGDLFELASIHGDPIQVNGTPVDSHILSSGDLIVVGEHGPVIRFRIYGDPKKRFKSIPEALADCRDSARAEKKSLPGLVWSFLRNAPHEMLRQTAPWTRTATFALMTALLVATLYLGFMSLQFQRELATQIETLTLVREERQAMTNEELEALRGALESRLSETLERVEALENMTEAGKRIVTNSSQSVVFLLGDFGFVNADGNPLRTVVGPDGRPVINRNGTPAVSSDGTGPPFRSEFTGTGFVATENGLILTNRHVVLPWEFDMGSRSLMSIGYRAVMNRMVGYFPGDALPFLVSLVVASDSVDLAVLQCEAEHEHASAIPLSDQSASPGDEVFVMGYPTGIRALLARTDVRFVNRLLEETKRDFWTIAQRLAEAGHIAPLATSGIVGQVTPTNVVYDAETTHGGSGGPVIGLDGRVVAINAAILNDFGGSNLGVPVNQARILLEQAAALLPAEEPAASVTPDAG